MQIAEEIRYLLEKNLKISKLEIANQSHLHDSHASSPKNGQSHFHLIIHSIDFANLNKPQSQRKVFEILANIMPKIHALSMELSVD